MGLTTTTDRMAPLLASSCHLMCCACQKALRKAERALARGAGSGWPNRRESPRRSPLLLQPIWRPALKAQAVTLLAPSVNVPGCRWCLTFRSRQLPAPTGLRTRPSFRTSRTLATPATKTAAQNQEKPLTLMTLTTLTREHDRRYWPSPLAISLHSKNIRSLSQTLTRSSCFSSPHPPNTKHMFPLPSIPPYVPSQPCFGLNASLPIF